MNNSNKLYGITINDINKRNVINEMESHEYNK